MVQRDVLGRGACEGRWLGCDLTLVATRRGGAILALDYAPWTATRSLDRDDLRALARLNRDDGVTRAARPLVAELGAAVAAIAGRSNVNVSGDDLNDLGRVASALLGAIEGGGEA